MNSCLLCLQKRASNIKISHKVSDNRTVQEAIVENFSYHELLLQGSSSQPQCVCKSCFTSLKNFYEFLSKVHRKHFQQVEIKVEKVELPAESFDFLNFLTDEQQVDLDLLKCDVKVEPDLNLRPVTEVLVLEGRKENLEVDWPMDEEKLEVSKEKVEAGNEGEENENEENENEENDSDFEWKLNEQQAQEQAELEAEYQEQKPKKKRKCDSDSDYELCKKEKEALKKSKIVSSKPPKQPPAPKIFCSDDRIRQFCELKCHECNTTIDTFSNLTKHFLKFHKGIKRYLICCHRKIFRRSRLNEHFQRHDVTIENRCEICGKTFISLYSLRSHIKNMHSGNPRPELEKLVCTECGKIFKGNSALKIHRKTHEAPGPGKTFECYVCKRTGYKHLLSLQSHFKNFHHPTRPAKLTCEICGKRMNSISLKDHIKTVHNKVPAKREQCQICERWIVKNAMKLHMIRHTTDLSMSCKLCGKVLKSKSSLYSHIKILHEDNAKRFKCPHCDRTYYTKGKMLEHEAAVHTREFRFHCRVAGCDRKFRAEANWKLHERRWHPEEAKILNKPSYNRAPGESVPDIENPS